MTNTEEKQKKRSRKPQRAILTSTEEERLRNGVISRQLTYNIRQKTMKALMIDFEKIEFYKIFGNNIPFKRDSKKILEVYFNLTKYHIMNEKRQRGVKRKVSPIKVWERITEEIS